MSIFDYLRKRNPSASVAKERLQIIISHERAQRSTPDYLPKLQAEIIAVISKYVAIDPKQVMVSLDRHDDNSAVLELNITMPEEALTASSALNTSSTAINAPKENTQSNPNPHKKKKKHKKNRATAI
jgi:cell division topological specificity factor